MSNRERLQINNEEIQEMINLANTLPDYEDLNPEITEQDDLISEFAFSVENYQGGNAGGKDYTASNLSADINDVCYGKGIWAAATNEGIYYSEDGKTWTLSNNSNSILNIAYADGSWIAISFYNIFYSLDGKVWNVSEIAETSSSYENISLHYISGVWNVYMTDIWNQTYCVRSQDGGKTWITENDFVYENLTHTGIQREFGYRNGVWIGQGITSSSLTRAGGGSPHYIFHSFDGINWTADLAYDNYTAFHGYMVPSNNDSGPILLYLESERFIDGSPLQFIKSSDGVTWETISITDVFPNGNNGCVFSGYYSNGVYVVSGVSGLSCSFDNGQTWVQPTSTGSIFNFTVLETVLGQPGVGIVCKNNNWFIYGNERLNEPQVPYTCNLDGVYWSSNGFNWIKTDLPSREVYEIDYINGQFLTTKSAIGLWTSKDGVNWSSTPLSFPIKKVVEANGIQVVASANGIYYINTNRGGN